MLPTNLGACKPTFYTFPTSDLRWNRTMSRSFYHTDLGQNAVVLNFAIQIALIYIQDDQSTRGRLAKPLKKFPKLPIRPAGSHFLLAPNCNESWVFESKLIELRFYIVKNFLFLFFYLMVLERCVIFKSVWYARILRTPASDVHERLKTNGTAIKIPRETTNNP